jgi:molecular chaperone GrpE
VTEDRRRVEEAAADEAAASSEDAGDRAAHAAGGARREAALRDNEASRATAGDIADAFDSRPADGSGDAADAADAADADEGAGAPADRDDVAVYREHLQRLQAEFENYRKRVLKEQTQAVELAARPVIQRLLEVLDDFDLALMHAQDRPDFDRFLHGVELVYAKLVDTLRAEGLERIEAQGKPFDPELHEALMQTGSGDGDPVVADVLRPGYTLKGRVLRPAGVRVERT